jgi:hypothetical protein
MKRLIDPGKSYRSMDQIYNIMLIGHPFTIREPLRHSTSYYALVRSFNELTNLFINVEKTVSVGADEHGYFNVMQLC